MKNLFLILLTAVCLQNQGYSQADAISTYFSQYVEDERFTVVYISAKMFDLLGKLDKEDLNDQESDEVMKVVSDLRGLRLLSTDTLTQQFYQEAIKRINTKEYEMLMKVRDGNENVHFLIRESNNTIHELLLLIGGDTNFTLISFVGNINLSEMSKLGDVLEINGSNHLEKLEAY